MRKQVQCEICGKMVATCGITSHLKFHENEKRRQEEKEARRRERLGLRDDLFCQYCNKQFKNLNALTQHEVRCKENPDKIDTSIHVEAMLEAHRKDPSKRGRPNPDAAKWKTDKSLICTFCGRSNNQNLEKFTNLYELMHHESTCRYNPAKGSQDISPLENELDDDGKLFPKFSRKRSNAKSTNMDFELTFHEFCTLIKEAGIKSSHLDRKGDSYELARYNDEGPYKVGNCRFIPQIENLRERKTSPCMKAALSKGTFASVESRKKNPEKCKKVHRQGILNSSYYQSKRSNQDPESKYRKQLIRLLKRYCYKKKEEERKANLDQRYTGEHNSQLGTHWITDGEINKKWHPDQGLIPEGFRLGRVNGNKPQSS